MNRVFTKKTQLIFSPFFAKTIVLNGGLVIRVMFEIVTHTEISFKVYYNKAEDLSGEVTFTGAMGQSTKMNNILRFPLL